jgi:hypothetical protein
VSRQSQEAAQIRRHHGRTIAHGDHGIDGPPFELFEDVIDRPPFLVEAHGNRVVAPGVLELIATVGGVHDLDAETSRRFREHARLVTGRRRQ